MRNDHLPPRGAGYTSHVRGYIFTSWSLSIPICVYPRACVETEDELVGGLQLSLESGAKEQHNLYWISLFKFRIRLKNKKKYIN